MPTDMIDTRPAAVQSGPAEPTRPVQRGCGRCPR